MSAVVKYDPAQERLENLKATALLSVLGLGATAAAYLGLKSLIKKFEANHELKNSANEGDPATYATQFKMAFDNDNWLGWGTNLTMVFNTITAIPTKKAFSKVQASYKALYNRNLNADLTDELSTDEYSKFIRMLAAKKDS
jgi:hypothetical protein